MIRMNLRAFLLVCSLGLFLFSTQARAQDGPFLKAAKENDEATIRTLITALEVRRATIFTSRSIPPSMTTQQVFASLTPVWNEATMLTNDALEALSYSTLNNKRNISTLISEGIRLPELRFGDWHDDALVDILNQAASNHSLDSIRRLATRLEYLFPRALKKAEAQAQLNGNWTTFINLIDFAVIEHTNRDSNKVLSDAISEARKSPTWNSATLLAFFNHPRLSPGVILSAGQTSPPIYRENPEGTAAYLIALTNLKNNGTHGAQFRIPRTRVAALAGGLVLQLNKHVRRIQVIEASASKVKSQSHAKVAMLKGIDALREDTRRYVVALIKMTQAGVPFAENHRKALANGSYAIDLYGTQEERLLISPELQRFQAELVLRTARTDVILHKIMAYLDPVFQPCLTVSKDYPERSEVESALRNGREAPSQGVRDLFFSINVFRTEPLDIHWRPQRSSSPSNGSSSLSNSAAERARQQIMSKKMAEENKEESEPHSHKRSKESDRMTYSNASDLSDTGSSSGTETEVETAMEDDLTGLALTVSHENLFPASPKTTPKAEDTATGLPVDPSVTPMENVD